jgi:hypothetical protein
MVVENMSSSISHNSHALLRMHIPAAYDSRNYAHSPLEAVLTLQRRLQMGQTKCAYPEPKPCSERAHVSVWYITLSASALHSPAAGG